ncbi:competence/damage-inducible protein A [Halochromatium glycolicum]|uniref:Competence/damage-inducible protein A n=1 Tax=Halochromatium glycolicum TaxID=85075 RepID=A0AAJ0X7X7_9GAMM|nr:molybdopterin-binding protein [Halochromatium glycolicum]MBK1703489.1 competence/damage-inducible protein A [Halochromatium glycolicum]
MTPSPGDASGRPLPVAFGLIVIGDEILTGTRQDRHLAAFKERLSARGHQLAWCWILPDDPELLTRHLAASMSADAPVFCCGGIGATPDDSTRACAAAAAEVELVRHQEAARLIEGRFGADAYPQRIRMADLPDGSSLIPNPVNQVPGFCLQGHWFLPGFPQMAWPMAEWVLDTHYGCATEPLHEEALVVRGVPESRLIPLMERLGAEFPDLKLFSLPHLGDTEPEHHILLGFRGRGDLGPAMATLRAGLEAEGVEHRER